MNNERILAHGMSKKLNIEDLKDVSAAGTTTATGHVTFRDMGTDGDADVTVDL
jgi:hypothetical protein